MAGSQSGSALWQVAGSHSGSALWQVAGSQSGSALWPVAGSHSGSALWQVAGSQSGSALWQVAGSQSGSALWQVAGSQSGSALWQVAGLHSGSALWQVAQVDPQHAQFCGGEMNVSDVVHSMCKLLWQLMFSVQGQNCYDGLCSVCMGKLLWWFMFCVHHHWGGRSQLLECWTKEPGAILTQGLISQCGKEFLSWSQLSAQTFTVFAQLLCAVACINICVDAFSKPWYLPPFLWGRRSWTDAGSLVHALKPPAIPLFERTKTLHTLVGVGSTALVAAVALPR